jgi:hypothetical protein
LYIRFIYYIHIQYIHATAARRERFVAHVVNQRVDEKKIKTRKQKVSSPMLDEALKLPISALTKK